MTPHKRSIREISSKWRSEMESGRTPFYGELGNLLDDFRKRCQTEDEMMALVSTPPVATGQPETDAYLAAVTESLCREHGMLPPAWTEESVYFLPQPWFAGGMESLKAILLVESPVAFRRRNLFVSANALDRV